MLKKIGMSMLSTTILLSSSFVLGERTSAATDFSVTYYKEWEPNNTLKTADDIGLDGMVLGTLDENDLEGVDIFKLVPKRTNIANFHLWWKSKNAYDLTLLDENGNTLVISDRNIVNSRNIYYKVKEGITYYIKIKANKIYGIDNSYELGVWSEGNYTPPKDK
ncbi:hypothetical protein P4G82_29050 [Bacillus cereus]|nr:hypothetical protein [Bacillus cereus]